MRSIPANANKRNVTLRGTYNTYAHSFGWQFRAAFIISYHDNSCLLADWKTEAFFRPLQKSSSSLICRTCEVIHNERMENKQATVIAHSFPRHVCSVLVAPCEWRLSALSASERTRRRVLTVCTLMWLFGGCFFERKTSETHSSERAAYPTRLTKSYVSWLATRSELPSNVVFNSCLS